MCVYCHYWQNNKVITFFEVGKFVITPFRRFVLTLVWLLPVFPASFFLFFPWFYSGSYVVGVSTPFPQFSLRLGCYLLTRHCMVLYYKIILHFSTLSEFAFSFHLRMINVSIAHIWYYYHFNRLRSYYI